MGRPLPPVALIGGANGSGKSTLLRFILEAAARALVDSPNFSQTYPVPDEAWVDWEIQSAQGLAYKVRFLVGSKAFVDANAKPDCIGIVSAKTLLKPTFSGTAAALRDALRSSIRDTDPVWPRVFFMPSEVRDLVVPGARYKTPGSLEALKDFVVTWERPSDRQWKGSTLELFYAARWADLNAIERGQRELAREFDLYAGAFKTFTRGTKQLEWTARGELVVHLSTGQTHPVEALSAGEKQVILLLAELRRWWRTGSLILIDEPELHLHDTWQGGLYDALWSLQRELGGQVILATQSHSLFEMAELGTRVLLGRGGLR